MIITFYKLKLFKISPYIATDSLRLGKVHNGSFDCCDLTRGNGTLDNGRII